jgi:hypothetical protein
MVSFRSVKEQGCILSGARSMGARSMQLIFVSTIYFSQATGGNEACKCISHFPYVKLGCKKYDRGADLDSYFNARISLVFGLTDQTTTGRMEAKNGDFFFTPTLSMFSQIFHGTMVGFKNC